VTAVQSEDVLDLAAPGAVVLYGGEPGTEAWFDARRSGVTATDVVAVVQAYEPGYRWARTPMHVWLDKRGELPPDPGGQAAEAGHRLEPVIAQWWADAHGTTVSPVGVLARMSDRWMVASPDRAVDSCPDSEGPCGLEIKNRNAYVAGKWRDDVPDDVLAQAAWQMAVTGWGHVHIAALIGGNTPRWHRVDRDPGLEDYLIGEAARLWACVLSGEPPVVDPSAALARLYDSLYTERDGGEVIDTAKAADMYARYRLGSALEARGKALKATCRDEAVVALGVAEELWVAGQVKPLVTYKAGGGADILPADELRRLLRDRPKVYALLKREGFITAQKSTRTLRWTKRVGEAINE
jgi:putative phage-type endonuclease